MERLEVKRGLLTRAVGLLRPEPLVIGFCFLLPDLMDKPLWVLGVIPDGRYIGHTLLMVLLVAFVFGTIKWTYGLLALCSLMPHLFFDTGGNSYNPWYYPFRHYDFPPNDYHTIVTLHNLLVTLREMLLVFGVLVLVWAVFRGIVLLFRGRSGTGLVGGGDTAGVSRGNSGGDQAPAHGGGLCWTARVSGTLLSLPAAAYLLLARATYDSAWPAIPAALCLLALTVAPSVAAWWSHRVGGGFLLIVCIAYAELAYGILEDAGSLYAVIPFLAVWAAAGILHLMVWRRESRPVGKALTSPRFHG